MYKFYCKSSENMRELDDNSVHLVITSPPYNVGKEYEEEIPFYDYLLMLDNVFTECKRVLVDGGRICVNIANIGRTPYITYSNSICDLLEDDNFHMRGEIIWNKGASVGVSTAWGSWKSASNPVLRDVHEYILVFSKGSYKREKGESTITGEQFTAWTKSIWDMKTESAKKIGHPAPFPVELPHRLIQLYSYKNDLVLDPFMGSGSTAIACIQDGRNFVGYDIQEKYIQLANDRINEYMVKLVSQSSSKPLL